MPDHGELPRRNKHILVGPPKKPSGRILLTVVGILAFGLVGIWYTSLPENLTYCHKGNDARNGGNHVRAVEHYTRCIDEGRLSDRKVIVALTLRAGSYRKIGQFEKVIADAREILRLDAYETSAHLFMALGFHRLRQYDKALDAIDQAIRMRPGEIPYYASKVEIQIDRGLYQDAVATIDLALKQDVNHAMLFAFRGIAHLGLDDPEAAFADMSEALRYDSGSAHILNLRGDILSRLGRHHAAQRSFKKAIMFEPDDENILVTRATAHAAAQRFDDAFEDLERAQQINANNPSIFVQRGEQYVNLGNFTKAFDSFDRAVEVDPDNYESYRARGFARFMNGEHRQSSADFHRSLKLSADEFVLTALEFHTLIWLYFAEARHKGEKAARASIGRHLGRFDQKRWPMPVIQYIDGDITADRLRELARDKKENLKRYKRCTANFVIGQSKLLEGAKRDAAAILTRVVDQCPKQRYYEHTAALYELNRL